jgi:hypothetical protein
LRTSWCVASAGDGLHFCGYGTCAGRGVACILGLYDGDQVLARSVGGGEQFGPAHRVALERYALPLALARVEDGHRPGDLSLPVLHALNAVLADVERILDAPERLQEGDLPIYVSVSSSAAAAAPEMTAGWMG